MEVSVERVNKRWARYTRRAMTTRQKKMTKMAALMSSLLRNSL